MLLLQPRRRRRRKHWRIVRHGQRNPDAGAKPIFWELAGDVVMGRFSSQTLPSKIVARPLRARLEERRNLFLELRADDTWVRRDPLIDVKGLGDLIGNVHLEVSARLREMVLPGESRAQVDGDVGVIGL